MCRMDELHLDYPFAGNRMLHDLLRREIRSLMRNLPDCSCLSASLKLNVAVIKQPHYNSRI